MDLGGFAPNRRVPHEFLDALVAELKREFPTVLVIEDVHWADEGTLDVVKLLARRIGALPALALIAFRDDQLSATGPLQIVLGELAGTRAAERRHIPPLSLGAVRMLAEPSSVDAEELFEKTGGNPFFVTEALAATGVDVPATVRDAVLARTAQLAPASRRLLEAAAVVPARTELWLLEAVGGEDFVQLEACLSSGMLVHEDGAIAFRHELARLAVEDAIAPDRRIGLHREVLEALSTSAHGPVDPARLSHHADAAGDVDAVLRYAPEAGERAAGLCVHREAADQFGRALRHGAALTPERRSELWERRSYESYLSQQLDAALEARQAALALHQERGDRVREGDDRRWLSRLAWFAADRATAVREARRAVELLEAEPPGRELAMAYSNAVAAGDACRRRGRGDRVRRACDRSRRAARGGRDPRARAEQRRRRRGARAAAGCSGEARAQSRARARVRVRGARRARLHKPRLRRCLGAQLRRAPTATSPPGSPTAWSTISIPGAST